MPFPQMLLMRKVLSKNVFCVCVFMKFFSEFLSELVELLLYVLLPDEDFQCRPLRFILRELMANSVILPLFMMLSDPDVINQAIIWLVMIRSFYVFNVIYIDFLTVFTGSNFT